MINIKGIPKGAILRFYCENKKLIKELVVENFAPAFSLKEKPYYLKVIVKHAKHNTFKTDEDAKTLNFIKLSDNKEISLLDYLIPDPLISSEEEFEGEKFPTYWMSNKLEVMFREARSDDNTMDKAFSRTMFLSSISEASLREILCNSSEDEDLYFCASCNGKELDNFNNMIEHITSRKCQLINKLYPSHALKEKSRLRGALHTIRIARNKLIHQLKVSNDELEKILNEYLSFGKVPYAKNKWGTINLIMVNLYCYLQNTLFFAALTKRNDEILSMRFNDYLLRYTDEDVQFFKIDVMH